MLKKLTKYRQELHQIPELGFDLFKTYDYVKNKLISFGYEPITYAKTGLVAVKKGKVKESIAFRADMDALPVKEETNVSFKSKHDEVMHACGHDGHMAMLLGFAEVVSKQELLNESIVFVFQPAEEGPGGARVMIEEGLLKDFNITNIFGLHLFPGIEENMVGIKKGAMLARNAEFDYDVIGLSSHGAQPHLGKDAVVASANFVVALNQIIPRFINPLEPAVITTGTINGGEARNIIANRVSIKGTIRAFNDSVFDILKEKIEDSKKGIENIFGVTISGGITDYYPAVYNNEKLYEIVKSSLNKNEICELEPFMFAEDFSFYQREIPGVFSFIGTRNIEKGYTYPLHSNKFNFDEKVLSNGVNYYINVSKKMGLF